MRAVVESDSLTVQTHGRGFHELTGQIAERIATAGLKAGLCSLFIRHTSAALVICENADPQVLLDLEAWMARLIVDGDPLFRHTAEGADDMPAHVRSVLTHTDLSVPVRDGRPALGTWQGIYLWEHRTRPHSREVLLTLVGDFG